MEALIENGQVVNIIVGHLDNSLPLEDIQPTLTEYQRIDGFTYDIQVDKVVKVYSIKTLTADEIRKANAPKTITLFQAREIVIKMGLFKTVEDTINSIEDDTQRLITRNYWEYSEVFERNYPILLSLTGALNITNEQLDDVFIEASKL